MKEVQVISCPLCGSRQHSVLHSRRLRGDSSCKVKVVFCRDCSLMFLNPVFTVEEYAEFYKKDYRQVSRNVTNDNGKVFDTELRGAFIVSSVAPYLTKDNAILEIGSGNGGILNAFKLAGFENVTGIEPNVEEAKFCNETLGITVHNKMFDGDLDQKFDLIIVSGTIDHIQLPNEFLCSVYDQLKPGGIVYIDSHDSVKQLTTADTFFKVDHCFYYSPFTLSQLAMKHGFRVIAFKEYNDYSNVVSFTHTSRQMDISSDNPHFYIIVKKELTKQEFAQSSLTKIHPWLLNVELRLIQKYSKFYSFRRFFRKCVRRLMY